MTPFVTAGAGFLLAVLWFDLMFDVQARGHRGEQVPLAVLDSIAAYYARVTVAARPMNRLVALAMLGTITAVVVQLVSGDAPTWLGVASLFLVGGPVALASTHTVPAAVRLGTGAVELARRGAVARSIGRDHLLCLASVAALLVVQLVAGP